jgi:hypothetical protein
MLHGRGFAFLVLVIVAALAVLADGQSVISTHAGVLHFFEGAVYLGDQPLESHLGKFPTLPQGGELRTEKCYLHRESSFASESKPKFA